MRFGQPRSAPPVALASIVRILKHLAILHHEFDLPERRDIR
jgi:hypothetical protein